MEQSVKLKAACGRPDVVCIQLGIVNELADEAAKKLD